MSTAVLEPYNNWPNDQGFDTDYEERTPIELKVTGKIPAYAAGLLYRTGPGGYKVDTEKGTTISMSHWFDGFTQVHRFQIIPSTDPSSSSRILYNSRHTVDALIENIRKSGSYDSFSFGQKRDPCQSFFGKVRSVFSPTAPSADGRHNTNIGVTVSVNPPGLPFIKDDDQEGHASGIKSLWTKTDASIFAQLDPETLEPMGFAEQTSLLPELKGPFAAAHAKSDPVTGDVFNYNLEVGKKATYRVFRVSAATGKTDILGTITDAPGAYLHSLILTENYVVLCVWAGHYAWHGAKVLWERNMLDALSEFDASQPTKWYVIDRKHGKGVVANYDGDPFFCFHTINAWEEPSSCDPLQTDIVADLSAYENLDVLKKFYYDHLKSTSPAARDFMKDKGATTRANIHRWRLPSITSDGTSARRKAILDFSVPKEKSCELPTMNPRFVTKPSRYIYGATDRGHSTFFDGLAKYDTKTQDAVFWHEHGHNPGEAIFIPNPNGTEEDDGILLSVVLDGYKGKSYLLVLDARTVKEVGRASLESAVGFGFHGTYAATGKNGLDY